MNGDSNSKAPVGDAPMVDVQPPKRSDLQPSYAQNINEGRDEQHGWYGSMINSLGSFIGTLGAVPLCICCPNPYHSVNQGSVGLITRFGALSRAVDPGLVKVNPLSERLIQVDVKIQIVEVPRQAVMTKDNVTLSLTSVIYYHIISPHRAIFGVSDLKTALMERTQTTLRHVIGARVLQEVIERREEIAQSISEIIEETAYEWGAKVESMLIKDIVFNQELQDSLSMAAAAKRSGEAKVITARAEVESAKLMRAAADILSSPAAMQIRYLETMASMSRSAGSKVIFLPATNQTGLSPQNQTSLNPQIALAEGSGEGPSSYVQQEQNSDFGFQSAMTARMTENM